MSADSLSSAQHGSEVKEQKHWGRNNDHFDRSAAHNCRMNSLKLLDRSPKWEASLLADGIRVTYDKVQNLNTPIKEENLYNKRPKSKLLYTVNSYENTPPFFYPKSVAINQKSGFAYVTDTYNNRVCSLTPFAIAAATTADDVGFDMPTGVAVTRSSDVIVADQNKERILVFTEDLILKDCISIDQQPFSITSDCSGNIICTTIQGFIQVLSPTGVLLHQYPLDPNFRRVKVTSQQRHELVTSYLTTDEREIVISNPRKREIYRYTYDGTLISTFEPSTCDGTLSCTPGAVQISRDLEIYVVDMLNRTVNAHDRTSGKFLRQVLGPADGVGAIQGMAVGPEGHVVITEYSENGPSYVKILRDGDCACHRNRPGTTKR